MTSSQLSTILAALPSDTPVYLYAEGREPLRCLCGEVLYAYHENHYTVDTAEIQPLSGNEKAVCLVLNAAKPL